jgi:hypothetical protein
VNQQPVSPQPTGQDPILDSLLERVNRLMADAAGSSPLTAASRGPAAKGPAVTATAAAPRKQRFTPREPETLSQAGLSEADVEALLLKLLLHCNDMTGRDTAEHIRLPFLMVEGVLRQMKADRLVVYRGSCPMNDYVYQLTDVGRERARRMLEQCTYYDTAPVSLEAYIASVHAQSITRQCPTKADLEQAFFDLRIPPPLLNRLGPAVCSGRGLFLYGAPGNGKTSIAERVTRAFEQQVWIPRALLVDGVIIRLFDPRCHEESPLKRSVALVDQSGVDRRWVRIKRPSIVVGGELTMDSLELAYNSSTNTCEAPVQLKSNCGTLVIDDFGRQRMSIDELLNRWILPLEKRYDFLSLPTGKKIEVPFDQLLIFSTNLKPRDLVDEAFLRRIPYKIEVNDPTEQEFRELFKMMCPKLHVPYREEPINHLIDQHYRATGRPFRCCQPRDLLLQVRNHCLYQGIPVELTNEHLDLAAETYFALF